MQDGNTTSRYYILKFTKITSLFRLESEDQEESVRPPVILPKCGRTTRFGGHCEYEQIFW